MTEGESGLQPAEVGGSTPSFLSSPDRKSMGGILEGLPSVTLGGAPGERVWPERERERDTYVFIYYTWFTMNNFANFCSLWRYKIFIIGYESWFT